MSSSEKSIFGSVRVLAGRAGQAARDATAVVKDAVKSAEPGVTAALTKAKTLADEKSAQAFEQVDAALARAKTSGATALSQVQNLGASAKAQVQKVRTPADRKDDRLQDR